MSWGLCWPGGVLIRDNIVVPVDANPSAPGNAGRTGGVTIPKINVDEGSLDVTIQGNQTVAITGYEGQRDWTVSGNIDLQDLQTKAEKHQASNNSEDT